MNISRERNKQAPAEGSPMKIILRLVSFSLCLVLLCGCALGEAHVCAASSSEPFDGSTPLLNLYICPLYGADCMVMTYGDLTMMIDGGLTEQVDTIRKMLDEIGVDHLDMFVNSHPHNDHLTGFLTMVEDGTLTADAFYTFFPHDYTEYTVSQVRAMKLCEEKGIQVIDVTDGDTIPFGGIDIRCMQFKRPKLINSPSVNNLSGVLRIQYGDCTLLLTGDIDGAAQRDLARRYDLHCDIVKAPHHGITYLDWAFMKDITPEYMFITHGAGNTATNQQLFDRYKIPYGFASWGMIRLTTDGTRWLVEQHVEDPRLQNDKRLKFY